MGSGNQRNADGHPSIFPPFQSPVMIRYAGLFCNRWKKPYLAQARSTLNQAEDSEPVPSPTWSERQAEYKGTDPLICPKCNNQLTLIGYYFGAWKSLQHRFDHAGKVASIAPFLLRPG
ncbi:MAG TPA: hypothetical protein PLK94_14750 [Alphaproteobacteria bacterium]|nr:hypothetical protein [Alphaproteobacteria bacterium]